VLTQRTAWHDFSKASLHQVRRLKELEPVLYDRSYCRPPYLEMPVYEIYRNCCDSEAKHLLLRHGLRYDVTVMPPLLLGEEYVKTMGHSHPYPEIFEVLEGEAWFLIQRKRLKEIDQVVLLVAREGDRILIPPNWGHVIINASSRRLIVGNLISQDCIENRNEYTTKRGAAFYVLPSARLVRNPRCSRMTDIRILKADAAISLENEPSLLASLLQEPNKLKSLSDSRKSGQQRTHMGLREVTGWRVAVVIPTLNEAECIGKVVEEISGYLDDEDEVLVVDRSDDNTPIVAASCGAEVIRQKGKGKGNALREAFAIVDADIVVMMDGDGSMSGKEISSFVQAVLSGADVVKGSRFVKGGGSEDITPFRKLGNLFFVVVANLLWSERFTDICYGFVAFRREALDRLKPSLVSADFQIETEICIKAKRFGLTVAEVPSFERRRMYGRSKLSAARDSLHILRSIVRERISSSMGPVNQCPTARLG